MKSRLSYFLISGIILLSIFVGILIWRNNNLQVIPKINEKGFNTPISSKYIPTNANLILHWKINPTKLPNYLENSQGKINKNITTKKIAFIRDSSFQLISLDFAKDLSKWAGDYGSFAVFDTNNQSLNDWLMVLEINKDENIEEVLESISYPKQIDEEMKSSYKLNISKSKIIEKKINSNKSIYFSTEKNYILIASNQKIIESSIKQSKVNAIDTKENYKEMQLKDNLNDGIFLLEISPKKIFDIIGQKKDLFELNKSKKLISSINLNQNNLIIEGVLSYENRSQSAINELNYDLIDIEKEFKSFDNFILIDNPKQYYANKAIHPYKKLIASLIKNSTTTDYSKLFKIILENTQGNLIWIKNKDWLVLTNKNDINKKKINDILKKDNFLNSSLDFKNKKLEIWSKITTNNNEEYEIKDNIEAIVQENENEYIWSKRLVSIPTFFNNKYLQDNIVIEQEKDGINHFDDSIRIHLGKEKTEVLLNNFYPYILLRTMLGNEFESPKAIDISVSVPTINYPDFIKFKVNLQTS